MKNIIILLVVAIISLSLWYKQQSDNEFAKLQTEIHNLPSIDTVRLNEIRKISVDLNKTTNHFKHITNSLEIEEAMYR